MTSHPHFTLEEFIRSYVASNYGINNTLPDDLYAIAENTLCMMEQVRKLLGFSVIITSGYRCKELNDKVGGVIDSQHALAEAVDFICPKYGTPEQIVQAIESSDIKYDQVIQEGTWVHISFKLDPTLNRGRALNKIDGGYEVR